jgi:hypothetical protein
MGNPRPDLPLLIVDHDRSSLESMGCLLWLNGYDSELADRILLAKQLLARGAYSLLICRNAMPDGDGPSLIAYAWEQFAIPAIAITGTLTAEQMAARVIRDALRGVIVIPAATQKTLLLTVAKALGRADVGPHHRQYTDYASQPCPDCHGTGHVLLLVSCKACTTCGGGGRIASGTNDWPLRHLTTLPALTRYLLYRRGVRTMRQAAALTERELENALAIPSPEASDLKKALEQAVAASS